MNNVIDMKTRQPREVVRELTPAEQSAAFVTTCADAMFLNAIKIRAVAGIDTALKALHQAADDIRNYGRK
jgi:hypothetical protein